MVPVAVPTAGGLHRPQGLYPELAATSNSIGILLDRSELHSSRWYFFPVLGRRLFLCRIQRRPSQDCRPIGIPGRFTTSSRFRLRRISSRTFPAHFAVHTKSPSRGLFCISLISLEKLGSGGRTGAGAACVDSSEGRTGAGAACVDSSEGTTGAGAACVDGSEGIGVGADRSPAQATWADR